MDKQYNRVRAESFFEIDSIIYLGHAFSSGIIEETKRFDFWQLYYCVSGTLRIQSDGAIIEIPARHAMFLEPRGDARTALRSTPEADSEFYVVSFECSSENLKEFARKAIPLYGAELRLIEELCTVGRRVLEPIKTDCLQQGLCVKAQTHPAALQYVKLSLEQLLLLLYCRLHRIVSLQDEGAKANRSNYERSLVKQAVEFMSANLDRRLTIGQLADGLGVNPTTLRTSFKKETGTSIMHAFGDMKITEAKRLICETGLNFSQIGEHLGFLSLYHFSRFFKEREGVTLSEFSRLVDKRRR